MAEQAPTKNGNALSGALLVAGTTIGAGMLALPLQTGASGFWPSIAINAACWLFMMCTGLLFLEVTLWMPDGSNVLSMARRFLGPPGKIIGGASFIFLYYCLMIAYFSGGVPIFLSIIQSSTGLMLPTWAGYALFGLLFGGIVFLGTHITDRINFLLMAGMILSYLLLVGLSSSSIKSSLLHRQEWDSSLLRSIPILFSAYGFHNIVPSISTYLKRNVKKLRLSIIVGTLIPFVIYSVWEFVIIGSIPNEELKNTLAAGGSAAKALQDLTGNSWIFMTVQFFSFFALVTSLLGVSLSMVDFFGDGLKMSRTGWNRLILTSIVFLPPLIFACANPGVFFKALGYAGGFGEAILNGLLPVLMVWIGRYVFKLKSDYALPGGRLMLIILLGLTVFVITQEILHICFST